MLKREIFSDIGLYDERFLCNEDKEFRKRLDKKYMVEHINLPLYRYRRHKNNMTNDIKKMSNYKI